MESMPKPPRPCIDRLPSGVGCPEYALAGKSRCETHQAEAIANGTRSPGTTPAWAKARKLALERDGYCCTRCGKTQAQAKAESKAGRGLEVHHLSGAGVRAKSHDLDDLRTLCRPCHLRTMTKKHRPTVEEWKAEIRAKVAARRGS
jgi:5-methylcytosine-specific restriction endonuclease McrA